MHKKRKERRYFLNFSLSLARLWIIISFFGVIFLVFIGTLIQRQPLYITGLLRTPKTSYQFDHKTVVKRTASSAFGAAKAYFVSFVICLFYVRHHRNIRRVWKRYRRI